METMYASKPMVYEPAPQKLELLCHGSYEDYEFYIYNHCGYPTAYVKLPQNHPLYSKTTNDYELEEIDVHGGISYSNDTLGRHPKGWYIGWDYAHMGDYRTCRIAMLNAPGKKYTTEEIIVDCQSVIDQLKERE